MKLTVDNRTGLLNDYYFQTLCLIYFPGEKFPTGDVCSQRHADVVMEASGSGFFCRVTLSEGDRSACGEFLSDGYRFSVPLSRDDEAQITAGRAFLQAGERLLGFCPPWGCITGLRPAKRARFFLSRGNGEDAVRRLFTDDYLVSAEKAQLTMLTAAAENLLLSSVSFGDCAMYISVPFCPTRCEYCSFISYASRKLFALIPDYLEKLTADIKQTAALISSLGLRLRAVYIGGGTPSILDEKQTERLLGAVSESIGGAGVTEFTYESGRPDTTTVEKLKIAKANGVNRISINPQSTSDFVLKEIGRNHTAAQFFSAAGAAFDVGFDCINADLIAGLPGDDGESFAKSLEDVIGLGYQNITVHTLSIKNASAIRFSRSGIYDPEGVFARECVSHSFGRLLGSGYGPYYFYRQKNIIGNAENTGYSLNGKEGIYNVLMMEEASSVFACGAGAITKLVSPDGSVIKRMAHPKYPFEYLSSDDTVGAEAVRKFYGGHFE